MNGSAHLSCQRTEDPDDLNVIFVLQVKGARPCCVLFGTTKGAAFSLKDLIVIRELQYAKKRRSKSSSRNNGNLIVKENVKATGAI